MACLPTASKCEWYEIQHFVAHYNEVNQSNYRRKECLDRNSETAQPEVLCEDPDTNKTIVIERKNLIWPLDYVEEHKRDHAFYDALSSNLGEMTKDHPFELRVNTPSRGNVIELEKKAQQLSDALKLHIPTMEEGTHVVIREPAEAIVEHPFGTIKRTMNQGYFLTRRIPKVTTEMSLTVLCYNLRRVINILGAKGMMQSLTPA